MTPGLIKASSNSEEIDEYGVICLKYSALPEELRNGDW
jgi:hypothetical protein